MTMMMDNTNSSGLANTTRFPFRLHKMLEEACHTGREDLITWLPCGTKFRISNKQEEFAETILSKYCRVPKYKSFLRSLSMYKFQRVSSGHAKGAYFHPHFIRNRLDLAEYINRQRIEELPASKLVPPPVVIPLTESVSTSPSLPTSMFQLNNNNNNNKNSFETMMNQSYNGTIVSLEEDKTLQNRGGFFTPPSWCNNTDIQVELVPSTNASLLCPSSAPPSKDIVNEIINTFRSLEESPRPLDDMDNLSLAFSAAEGQDDDLEELLPFERLEEMDTFSTAV